MADTAQVADQERLHHQPLNGTDKENGRGFGVVKDAVENIRQVINCTDFWYKVDLSFGSGYSGNAAGERRRLK